MKNYCAILFCLFQMTGNAAEMKCTYLDQLSTDSTETQRRAALLSCRELMEQKTLLLAAQVKYKEISERLRNPKDPQKELLLEQGGANALAKMLSSEQIFLLNLAGFKSQRKVKIFFKGRYYFLTEGERFSGGTLLSVGLNTISIASKGTKRRIHLTTVEEMQLTLGLIPEKSTKTAPMAFGRVQ